MQFNLPPRDTRSIDKQARKLKPESAGKQWFDLPAQQLTNETRRDLKLLQLRGTFDPKRFYKSSDHKKALPKFFQIGTVVEASADFYSGVTEETWAPFLQMNDPAVRCFDILVLSWQGCKLALGGVASSGQSIDRVCHECM